MASNSEHDRSYPESTSRRNFRSGDPHTQTSADTQGSVTGSDEIKAGEPLPRAVADLADDVMHMHVEKDQGSVDPQRIPRRKFGSGDPHTQTGDDTQGMVAGSDERKEGEPVPEGLADLVQDAAHPRVDSRDDRGAGPGGGGGGGVYGGGGCGGGASAARQRRAPAEGASAASDAYGSSE